MNNGIDTFAAGGSSFLYLRDASADTSGNRNGYQQIDFRRTTASEAFGANQTPDWRVATDTSGNFNVYRKSTTPNIGVLYDGNVMEFKPDGDINIYTEGWWAFHR